MAAGNRKRRETYTIMACTLSTISHHITLAHHMSCLALGLASLILSPNYIPPNQSEQRTPITEDGGDCKGKGDKLTL